MSHLRHVILFIGLISGTWACHAKQVSKTTSPESTKVPGTTPKVPDTLTPTQHIDALNAQLPKEAAQTRGVDGLSAEGTIFSHFTTAKDATKASPPKTQPTVDKVVIARKGETFDETISIYYKSAQPVFVQRIHHFNPAKLMRPEDKAYNAAIKSKSTETNVWQFQGGTLQSTAKKGDTTQLALERRMADHAQWSLRMMRIQTGKACQWRCSGDGDLCGQITCQATQTP